MRTFLAAAALVLLPSLAFAEEKLEASTASSGGAAPNVRVGALVGAGAPSLVSAEAVVQYRSHLALAFDYGMTPTVHLPAGPGLALSEASFSLAARVRPFAGDLYLGLALGNQRFEASFTNPTPGGPSADGATSTIFVMPEVGFLHRFANGLALGSEIGVEIPVSGAMTDRATLPPGPGDALHMMTTTPVPVVNLFRLGYVL